MIKAVIFDMYETLITLLVGPMYFGADMAADAGIEKEIFMPMWNAAEDDRSVGKQTLEDTVEWILKENNCYTKELFATLIRKRKESRKACFEHLHPEIIPMLDALKKKGLKIGLISNCFSEEAEVIRESILFPYFDAPCLSYEMKVQKPDEAIFLGCMKALEVTPQECLYVGDGGSFELEAASKLGMNVLQAAWYLKEGTRQPAKRKPEFTQAEAPLEVVEYCERLRADFGGIYMKKQDAITLFHYIHPNFFEREYIQNLDEDEIFDEMLLRLDEFDANKYDKAFDTSVTFGFYEGDRVELLKAVEQVNAGWINYFGEEDRVLCGYFDGKVVSFCLVENMGTHTINGETMKVGGPGCVGTLPEYRDKGIGLMMVKKATQILKDEGYDYSYIHFTGVAQWYAKLGYETVLKWNKKGIV